MKMAKAEKFLQGVGHDEMFNLPQKFFSEQFDLRPGLRDNFVERDISALSSLLDALALPL